MITAGQNTASQAAMRLTHRDYLSYSAVNLFRSCPLRFKFRYLDGLPEESVSASLVFGSAIHRAAELQFNRLMADEPLPGLDELLVAYHDSWRAQHEAGDVRFAKGDDQAPLTQLATRMLAVFRDSSAVQPAGDLLGVEEELRGSIIPGVPDLLGRIDLLVETKDAVLQQKKIDEFSFRARNPRAGAVLKRVSFGAGICSRLKPSGKCQL